MFFRMQFFDGGDETGRSPYKADIGIRISWKKVRNPVVITPE